MNFILKLSIVFIRYSLFFYVGLSISSPLKPIKVGLSGPQTGGSASMGISLFHGAHIAVDEINEKGGVLGRELIFVERDDQSNLDIANQIAKDLIHNESIVAHIGYCNTGLVLGSASNFQEAKIPLIIPCSSGTAPTQMYLNQPINVIFRVGLNEFYQAKMIAHEIVKRRGLKRIAMLSDTTPYGVGTARDNIEALSGYAVTPIMHEKFNIGDLDMSVQLKKAKELKADVILAIGIGPELAVIAKNMKHLKIETPLIGTWTMGQTSFLDNAGFAGNYATMPETFIQASNTKLKKKFIDKYLERYKPFNRRIGSCIAAAQSYDAVYLLSLAIEQAQTTDSVSIIRALENLEKPYDGLIKYYKAPYSFQNHECLNDEDAVMGMVINGRVVYGYREDSKKLMNKERSLHHGDENNL
jgi:branched-chain amino acid transport system substrate-binding protein